MFLGLLAELLVVSFLIPEAKKILDSLTKSRQAVAAEQLQNRIALCEHAVQLAISVTPSQAKFSNLKANVGQTASLWRLYPFSLQIKLALRFAWRS